MDCRRATRAVAVSPILAQEMEEQGRVLAERAGVGQPAARRATALLSRADVTHVLVAARGSSDNAGRFAQYLWGRESRLVVALTTPSLFRDPDTAPRLEGAAVVGISQSGRSPDIVAVLAAARAQARPTIAIVGDETSPLAAEADVVIPLLAGAERSVAATKTYLASLHAIVQVQEALSPSATRRHWLEGSATMVDRAVKRELASRERFDALTAARLITVCGRGLAFATAFETALKLRELSGIPAEAFSPPDLIHGPIAALGKDTAVWAIQASHDPSEAALLAPPLERAGVGVVVGHDSGLLEAADVSTPLPADAPEWLGAMLATVVGQAAALRLAELRGVDVDRPHGLTKITLTR